MAKYSFRYINKNNKMIYKKGTSGGGGSASNPNKAIKKAEDNINDFPGTIKIELFKDSKNTSVKYGTWNINKQKWEVRVDF